MASTSQLREWWDDWKCDTTTFVRAPFPGPDGVWELYVANASAPIWDAVIGIMKTEPYYFRESAGGTYNCRKISGSNNYSLHSYGIALDLNPKANPQKSPLTYDYPPSFLERMKGIRANGKPALTWGGDWTSTTPDAMHWQINVAPSDCKNVTWDKGEPMDGPNGEPNWDEVSDWAQKAWTQAHKAGLLTDDSHPRDSLEVEQMMVYLDRAKVI